MLASTEILRVRKYLIAMNLFSIQAQNSLTLRMLPNPLNTGLEMGLKVGRKSVLLRLIFWGGIIAMFDCNLRNADF